MKLLYCAHCQDIVKLFPEKRYCKCGKSWGHYLEDNSTTVQTFPSLSLGIANPDFHAAVAEWQKDTKSWSPMITMRSWINPASEPDVTFVRGEPLPDEEEPAAEEAEA
ncbi:hypothetical protein Caci_7801 [Catenulispora acidiphila DSM 44928]|uniref:Uncharacterized protein n=1 Tax=Catenulispora acidiphila (strain DSM 44928 / JCM 14897 / NBRC 102108 / NRRL B-24433 / ID139908) TaxID=479433 RepID=C7QE37_CATAD|nr:hypothetical protein [Catenulispora acidiphila]ACU76625.1 hypothetical protein Caci_7801 [Catenulispora acidiphila DSM 44928]